jgi:hypothetical protein
MVRFRSPCHQMLSFMKCRRLSQLIGGRIYRGVMPDQGAACRRRNSSSLNRRNRDHVLLPGLRYVSNVS